MIVSPGGIMPYELSFTKTFFTDYACAPKPVKNAFDKTAEDHLRKTPEKTGGPIKKLTGLKRVYRYRISDSYRIIYCMDGDHVILLMLGDRKNVYDRLKYDPEKEIPKQGMIALVPDIVDPTPSDEDRGAAQLAMRKDSEHGSAYQEKPLPVPLNAENLTSWGIDAKYHKVLIQCESEDQLLAAPVPEPVASSILNILYPPAIDTVMNTPKFVMVKSGEMEQVASGFRDLSSFLLKLDSKQREFVQRFAQRAGREGPWIVKGGPGSGKSTMALYSIVSLVSNKLPIDGANLRTQPSILFTTYTNSLVNSSSQLLRSVLGDSDTRKVQVQTMNSLAVSIARSPRWNFRFPKDEREHRDIMEEAIQEAESKGKSKSFKIADAAFIEEEIEWLILGNCLTSLADYAGIERKGRGRALGKRQREELWAIYELYWEKLNNKHLTTHDVVVCSAYERAKQLPEDKKYDFVFIDEAQDFKPVALRLCLALCKNPKNVYLTADMNQGIYGHGISWSSIDDALRFTTGRSQRLEKNYRSTKEIIQALKNIAQHIDQKDAETLDDHFVYTGEPPILKFYKDRAEEFQSTEDFIIDNCHKLNMGLGCAAILCRNIKDAQEIAKNLSPKLKAKYMRPKDVDIDYNGVKVMTIHSAKGLQFPIVIVARVNRGVFPVPVYGGQDPEEHLNLEWNYGRKVLAGAIRGTRTAQIQNDCRGIPMPESHDTVCYRGFSLITGKYGQRKSDYMLRQ